MPPPQIFVFLIPCYIIVKVMVNIGQKLYASFVFLTAFYKHILCLILIKWAHIEVLDTKHFILIFKYVTNKINIDLDLDLNYQII